MADVMGSLETRYDPEAEACSPAWSDFILFVGVNRDGSISQTCRLWRARKTESGEWSMVIRLGPATGD